MKNMLFLFLIVPAILSAQSVKINLQLDSSLVRPYLNANLSDWLNLQASDDMKIADMKLFLASDYLGVSAEVNYKLDTGFMGFKTTIAGGIESKWKPFADGKGIGLKLDDLTFRNKNDALSMMDGTITSTIMNFIPTTFSLPITTLDPLINPVLEQIEDPYPRPQVKNGSFSDLELRDFNLTGILNMEMELVAGNPRSIGPGFNLGFGRSWLQDRLETELDKNKNLTVHQVELALADQNWRVITRTDYRTTILWFIPIEITRTVDLSVIPQLQDDGLKIEKQSLDVYDDHPGEFSLINWFIKGQLGDIVDQSLQPGNLLGKTIMISDHDITGEMTVTGYQFKAIKWDSESIWIASDFEVDVTLKGKTVSSK